MALMRANFLFVLLLGFLSSSGFVSAAVISKYTFMGCFKDNGVRDMVDPVFVQDNSLEFCANRCASKGYSFFGVQNGQDCWCGNSYNNDKALHAKVPDNECNMPCAGKPEQMCGNAWRNGVFSTGNFPRKSDNEDKACAAEQGFCVLSDGSDQNSGVIKLNSIDGNTLQAQNDCLEKCANNPDATGCEVIWDQGNRGCYVHTQSIARGNDVDRHLCWVFSKCNGI